MAEDDLPERCLRGLRKSEWVKQQKHIAAAAFVADDKAADEARKAAGHEPAGSELSINWEDGPHVEELTLATQHARHGAARVTRADLDHVNRFSRLDGVVAYERRVVENNPHHGNILYVEGPPVGLRASAAAMIAASSEFVPPKR